MLGRDGDDPFAAVRRLLDRALERPVERLGRAPVKARRPPWQPDAPARPACAQPRSPPRPPGPSATASEDWRISPRSTAASPPPLPARPESSPDSRGRSCRLDAARPRCARHSATKASTSASLVSGPKLTRRKPTRNLGGHAHRRQHHGSPSCLPDEQALPAETAIPARSNWTSWLALRRPASRTRRSSAMRGLPRRSLRRPPT